MWNCQCKSIDDDEALYSMVHRSQTGENRIVILRRDGKVTDRFKSGGDVPLVIQAIVQEQEEDPFCPVCENFCSWSSELRSVDADELDEHADQLWRKAKERGELADYKR
jgi:hypothetical protein